MKKIKKNIYNNLKVIQKFKFKKVKNKLVKKKF